MKEPTDNQIQEFKREILQCADNAKHKKVKCVMEYMTESDACINCPMMIYKWWLDFKCPYYYGYYNMASHQALELDIMEKKLIKGNVNNADKKKRFKDFRN